MSRRKLPWLAVAAASMVLVVGLAACGDDDDDGGGSEASFTLTIGDLVPLTGDLSQFGPPGRKAANLAGEQANEAADAAGADITVEVEHADTETKPQPAQQAARKLISDGASCIAGAWGSAQTIPVGESVASRQNVPLISPASTSPEITTLEDDGFVNRVAPSDALQGQVLADAVEQKLGSADGKTASLAARNDAYGEGIINNFKDAWEEKGGETAGPVLYDTEQASYNSEAGRITSGSPDVFVIIDFEDPYGKVGAALARTGDFDPVKLWTADGLAFDEIPDSIPSNSLDGASGTRPASPETSSAAKAFDELYKAGGSPKARGTFDGQNFDAVITCFLAAVAAGSNDGTAIKDQIRSVTGPPGDKFTFEQLGDAVTALRNGDDIDYEGVTGPIDLDESGDPTSATYEVYGYKDGKLEVDRQVAAGTGAEGEDEDSEEESE